MSKEIKKKQPYSKLKWDQGKEQCFELTLEIERDQNGARKDDRRYLSYWQTKIKVTGPNSKRKRLNKRVPAYLMSIW